MIIDDSVQLDGQYQWQWEEKPGSWLIFDDKIQISLSEAFNDKEDEVCTKLVIFYKYPSCSFLNVLV